MKHTLIDGMQIPTAFEGCGAPPAAPALRMKDAPPVSVNGVRIEEEMIAREAQNHAAASADEARAAAARALVIRELLLQRAAVLGVVAAPERDEAGREETLEEALIREVLAQEVEAGEPSEEECRRVFAHAAARFAGGEIYAASHILFTPADGSDAAWTEAEQEALHAASMLAADARTFEALARERSKCPSAAHGGALGRLRTGDLSPEIEAALFALAAGDVAAAPVRTRFGWHVVRLDSAREREGYASVAPRIRAVLAARAWAASAARYVAALAHEAEIEGVTLDFSGGASP